MKLIVALLLGIIWISPAHAKPGDLDKSYGPNQQGFVRIQTTEGTPSINWMALKGEEVIWAGSRFLNGLNDFIVGKIDASGNVDASFGNGGYTITDLYDAWDIAYWVGIQGDGKIVVAGTGGVPELGMAAVQYDANGAINPAFGKDGTGSTAVCLPSLGTAAALDPNHDIMLAGNTHGHSGQASNALLARLSLDGHQDTAYGCKSTDVSGQNAADKVAAIVALGDAKSVIAGTDGNNLYVLRFNADGSKDTSFVGAGITMQTTNPQSTTSYDPSTAIQYSRHVPKRLLLQDGSKLIVVGNYFGGQVSGVFLYGLNADGSENSSFGPNGDGKVYPNLGNGAEVGAAALDNKGRIMLTGKTGGKIFVARLNKLGALDAKWGDQGIVKINAIDSGMGTAIAVDYKDRVLVALKGAHQAKAGTWIARFSSERAKTKLQKQLDLLIKKKATKP